MSKSAAAAIAGMLADARRILITSHRDPDGDSIGCQLAFYEYWTRRNGRRADVINHGKLPSKYEFLDPHGVVRTPETMGSHRRWNAAVVFECSALDRIGDVSRLLPPGLPIINIDHHEGNARFGRINIIDKDRSACGELLYDLLRHWQADITPRMAQLLAAAILTDTGRFHHPCTNVRTLETTAALLRLGANLTELTDHIYYSLPHSHFRLVHHILGKAEMREHGRICFLYLRASDRRQFRVPMREMEGLIDYSLSVEGVMVGVLLKELGPRKTKASLRSPGIVDVAAVARRFGGGGHKNAAGCMIDLPLRAAADALIGAVRPFPRVRRASRKH